MSSGAELKLQELAEQRARYDAICARALALSDVTGVPPSDNSIAIILDVRRLVDDQLATLDQLRGQLEAGNGFLSGFTLWMSRRNSKRLEGLLDKAEKERRAAIAANGQGGAL
ncbi:MAG: hypothetical protein ACO25F_09750 [Erythrobacter sp.]